MFVPDALCDVLRITTESDAQRAYDRLLYALGNNHAGTYYPVAVSAVPFCGELLQHHESKIRETALAVLLDLLGSFEAAAGFETVCTPWGGEQPLKAALGDAVVILRPMVEECASSGGESSREHALAAELLDLISPQITAIQEGIKPTFTILSNAKTFPLATNSGCTGVCIHGWQS